MKIAYQGIEGSYSESCAKELYPDCKTISCKTFDDVFNASPIAVPCKELI